TRAVSQLAAVICSSATTAAADWELNLAFWAYRSLLSDDAQESADKSENAWFGSIGKLCGLASSTSRRSFRTTAEQISCVANAYLKRAAEYRSKLEGDSLREALLTVEQHKQIQADLIAAGHYEGIVDGLFGMRTRIAIKAFQSSLGHRP